MDRRICVRLVGHHIIVGVIVSIEYTSLLLESSAVLSLTVSD